MRTTGNELRSYNSNATLRVSKLALTEGGGVAHYNIELIPFAEETDGVNSAPRLYSKPNCLQRG